MKNVPKSGLLAFLMASLYAAPAITGDANLQTLATLNCQIDSSENGNTAAEVQIMIDLSSIKDVPQIEKGYLTAKVDQNINANGQIAIKINDQVVATRDGKVKFKIISGDNMLQIQTNPIIAKDLLPITTYSNSYENSGAAYYGEDFRITWHDGSDRIRSTYRSEFKPKQPKSVDQNETSRSKKYVSFASAQDWAEGRLSVLDDRGVSISCRDAVVGQ